MGWEVRVCGGRVGGKGCMGVGVGGEGYMTVGWEVRGGGVMWEKGAPPQWDKCSSCSAQETSHTVTSCQLSSGAKCIFAADTILQMFICNFPCKNFSPPHWPRT